jgi:N-acetylmuramoyl-L-alanine amidase
MKVLLEVPHGDNVAGKCSPDKQFKEYLYGREIVPQIVSELRKCGIDAENLVPELYEPGLEERVRRVNAQCKKHGKDNCIFISVHVNAAGNGQWMNAQGWSAFTTKGHTKADVLAECLYESAAKCFKGRKIRTDKSDGDSDWEEQFYILKNTHCPAVLTENLFMDNEKDCKFLLSPEGIEAITALHVDAIININDELNKNI